MLQMLPGKHRYIMPLLRVMVRLISIVYSCVRADEIIGDTAVALLKAGAETDKKDVDGCLAMDLAPDSQVNHSQ